MKNTTKTSKIDKNYNNDQKISDKRVTKTTKYKLLKARKTRVKQLKNIKKETTNFILIRYVF